MNLWRKPRPPSNLGVPMKHVAPPRPNFLEIADAHATECAAAVARQLNNGFEPRDIAYPQFTAAEAPAVAYATAFADVMRELTAPELLLVPAVRRHVG